jgi:hypothetical protein
MRIFVSAEHAWRAAKLRAVQKEPRMIHISSKAVADYVAATNAFDADAMLATFKDDALVNRIYRPLPLEDDLPITPIEIRATMF